jgi:O-antigen/teichoic acid export membrane protein
MAGTGVLTPVTTAYHANHRHQEQKRLFLRGSKYCLALSLFFLPLFIVIGKPFIALWLGKGMESLAYSVLIVLALGELLPMSQWVTYSMLLGMGRHKLWACMSLLEIVTATGFALALQSRFGLLGVALSFAIPAAFSRGIIQMIYACRLVRLSLWQYGKKALLPPLVYAVVPSLCLIFLTEWKYPNTWLRLVFVTTVYSCSYVVSCLLLVAHDVGYHRAKFQSVQIVRALILRRPSESSVKAGQ